MNRMLQAITKSLRPDSSSDAAENRGRERVRRLILTAISNFAARGVSLATNLASVPLAIAYLGAEQYGTWMAVSALIALFGFTDLGVGNGLINEIAKASARDDIAAARRAVSSAFFVLLGVCAVIIALTCALYPYVGWDALFNAGPSSSAGGVVVALAFCLAFGLPLSVAQRVQMGFQTGFSAHLVQALSSAASLGTMLFAVSVGASFPVFVAMVAGAPLVVALANCIHLFWIQKPGLRPTPAAFSGSKARALLTSGGMFVILQLTAAAAFASDSLIIAKLLSPAAVAAYAVPARLFQILAIVPNMLLAPLWPAYGEALERGDVLWVRRTLRKSVVLAVIGTAAPALALAVFADRIVRLWVGGDFRVDPLLAWGFALSTVVLAAGAGVTMFMNGTGHLKLQVAVGIPMAIAAVALKIFFFYRWGVAAIPWAVVVSYTITALIPFALLFPRLMNSVARDSRIAGMAE